MKTLKVRIEPNSAQRKVIDRMIDANRLVYNGLVVACKQALDRDVNAAKNILRRTLSESNGMDQPSLSPS